MPRSAARRAADRGRRPGRVVALGGAAGLAALTHAPLLATFGWINLVIAGFNLIPALPMDGGRILRAALAPRFGHLRATEMAVKVSRVAAVAFALLGLMGSFQLLVLAPFIWMMGTRELMLAQAGAPRSFATGMRRFTIRQVNGRVVIDALGLTYGARVTTTFVAAATPVVDGDHYALDVPRGWGMGRGSSGGLVVGALVNAIELHVADGTRRVRSVTAEIPGPVEAGASELGVTILKRGSSVVAARSELVQRGEVRAHAGRRARRGSTGAAAISWQDLVAPVAPSWRGVEPIVGKPGQFPEFSHNFEYRLVDGTASPSGAAAGRGQAPTGEGS